MKDFRFTPAAQSTRGVIGTPRRLRFAVLSFFFIAWACIIVIRLAWLQLVEHHRFVELAARQQQHGFEIAPRRGMLYDRKLLPLAMTVGVSSVYADPSEISDKPATAKLLARVVHSDPAESFTTAKEISARLAAGRRFAWIARKLDAPTAAKVKALNLKGIYFQKEFKRFYPNDQLAAQVLGYVGTDDAGLGGVEREFDDDLHGTPGHMLATLDAKRQVLGSEEQEPLAGEDLQLTIDENIQYMAEQALDHAMAKTKALSGTVVVQDPHTGQILALAIRPTFNPNDFRHATNGLLRNHAVSDIYEPGSVFKLITYSAALQEKITTPDSMIDCQGGAITIFGRTIHDAPGEHYGRIRVEEALWHSSDVAAVKLAMAMGRDTFYKYIRSYGFGERTGIELPSETRGLLRPTRRWGATSIGSLAIGQEVGVTPLQLVSMVSAIGDGGTYLPPHVLLTASDAGTSPLQAHPFHPLEDVPSVLPEGAHRVISPLVSAEMRKMMEGIVLYGSGKDAALNGYSAAGKTGTAQKIDVATHTYSKTKLVASFAGFAPVSNPAISVAVVIDSPEGQHMGGQVSAPVFAEVAQQVLEYLGVPHDEQEKPVKNSAGKDGPAEGVDQRDSDPDEQEKMQAMFADVNDLPADDPLRHPQNAQLPAAPAMDGGSHGVSIKPSTLATVDAGGTSVPAVTVEQEIARLPASAAKAASSESDAGAPTPTPAGQPGAEPLIHARSAPGAAMAQNVPGTQNASATQNAPVAPSAPVAQNAPIVTDAKHRVPVPSLLGEPLRQVVETAEGAGLVLQALGTGIARTQFPAAGTMVPLGTQIVVHFQR